MKSPKAIVDALKVKLLPERRRAIEQRGNQQPRGLRSLSARNTSGFWTGRLSGFHRSPRNQLPGTRLRSRVGRIRRLDARVCVSGRHLPRARGSAHSSQRMLSVRWHWTPQMRGSRHRAVLPDAGIWTVPRDGATVQRRPCALQLTLAFSSVHAPLGCRSRPRRNRDCSACCDLDPLNDWAQPTLLGATLAAGGRHTEARRILEDAVGRRPDNAWAAATLILECAYARDWTTVNALMAPDRLERHPLRQFEPSGYLLCFGDARSFTCV